MKEANVERLFDQSTVYSYNTELCSSIEIILFLAINHPIVCNRKKITKRTQQRRKKSYQHNNIIIIIIQKNINLDF